MNYLNYEVTLYHSDAYILGIFGSLDQYVYEFTKHNSDLIISYNIDCSDGRLDMTVVLNGKEIHKNILQFGCVEIWRTYSRTSHLEIKQLKQIIDM